MSTRTLVTILCAVAFPFFSAAEETRPNVLLIAVDDLNDWLGCLGTHPQVQTPNMDRLAARGTLFTNAHCQAPICGPSRASLLTGLYPWSNGVYQQPGKGLSNDTRTFQGHLLPQYFEEHGYKTLGVGKITHGINPKKVFMEYGRQGSSGPKPENGFRFHYHLPDVPYSGTQTDWGAFPDHDTEMPDYEVASWTVEQLGRRHDKPFFLAAGFVRPHVPFYVPEKWFAAYPLETLVLPEVRIDDLDDVPEIGRAIHEMPKYPKLAWLQANENEQLKLAVQAYLACITFVDHQVGRVLDALDASPYAENTTILLFSDHGYHLGEKDRISKHTLWEESTRVPLIVARARSEANPSDAKVVNRSVGLIDIFPTLLELSHLPAKENNEGFSLFPLMENPEADWREATLTVYPRGSYAMRTDRYRYIHYEDGSEELYDHGNDPNEWTNLASDAEFAGVIDSLLHLLPEDAVPYHPSTSRSPINAWFETHLKSSLGGAEKK
ncbi:MAG: sulfatase [Verrucomicrobiota bacterium]